MGRSPLEAGGPPGSEPHDPLDGLLKLSERERFSLIGVEEPLKEGPLTRGIVA
jgi:hypothetical protein